VGKEGPGEEGRKIRGKTDFFSFKGRKENRNVGTSHKG
jgi:hypothetical protein